LAEYFDISEWNEQRWYGTKGTRNKVVVQNPNDGANYYFKSSLNKPGKDYKYEFWSEIIASEIGRTFGFNTLRYDIAFNKGEMGCISKFMNKEGETELTEGIQYLTGYKTTYKPKKKESKKEYTFQFICEALNFFEFKRYTEELIKIIIFDSIIGNGDRHQENWGIITNNKEAAKRLRNESRNLRHGYIRRKLIGLIAWSIENLPKTKTRYKIVFHSLMPSKFAPIYDNGSCLGRELLDDKVEQMLNNEKQLISYVRKGESEIHWDGKKVSHFELIKNIANEYTNEVKFEIARLIKCYSEFELLKIVHKIDGNLPEDKMQFKLPDNRKELIIKMITLRYTELIKILD